VERAIPLTDLEEWRTSLNPVSGLVEQHLWFAPDEANEHRMHSDLDRTVGNHTTPCESVLQEHAPWQRPDHVIERCGPCPRAQRRTTGLLDEDMVGRQRDDHCHEEGCR
jgi:hypothetical protein